MKKGEPQRHRGTEKNKIECFWARRARFPSLCLCASVVHRRTAATAQIVVILLMGVAMPASSAEEMTGAEIKVALAGDTTDGVWGEALTPYRQYFGANGATTYVEQGGAPSEGRWWTTVDAYCSTWGPLSTPNCYQLRREGETLHWVVPDSGKTYPSTVLPGRQLAP